MKKFKFLIAFALLLSSCSKKNNNPPTNRSNLPGLLKTTADYRKKAFSDILYSFKIDLSLANSNSTTYSGTSHIKFNVKKQNLHTKFSIDFRGGEVSQISINKKTIKDFDYNGSFISLKSELLKNKQNSIKINFIQKYNKNGSGLYRFKDKVDGLTYVYTNFEPYDANLFVPLFDQPNLKAKYKLEVKAPKNWNVISSAREASIDDSNQNFNHWTFPLSPKMSTYLFSLHGGPYKMWEANHTISKGQLIPLRLFSRQSLAKYVDPEFWFKTTKQGFSFFKYYFKTPYPYKKYDQIIVPDFNSGAMENVAAVTFNEFYISRELSRSRSNRRSLAKVILHEMAHMWFGNLVTMSWWNDLWLNESFASFMATTALYQATPFKEAWTHSLREKNYAYKTDQLRITHPIEQNVNSTEEAFSSFDSITYSKGASALKQLVFLIGETAFRKGLKEYFQNFANATTERKDLIKKFQSYTRADLNKWTTEWLKSKGLSLLSSEFKCKDGSLLSVNLKQTMLSGDPLLKSHKTLLSFWGKDLSQPFKIATVTYKGNLTVWRPKTQTACPLALFPNWEDHDYTRLSLDPLSFTYFSKNISKIKSNLFRNQIWSNINFTLQNGSLSPLKSIPLIIQNLPKENSLQVASQILKLSKPYHPIFYYYKDKKAAKNERIRFSNFLKKLITNTNSIDLKKLYFRNWAANTFIDSPEELILCLKKSCSFNQGFKIDIDKKWNLLSKLSSIKHPDTNSLLDKLLSEDPSQKGQLLNLKIKSSLSINKISLLEKTLKNKNLSLTQKKYTLRGLTPYAQRASNLSYKHQSFNKYIDSIKNLDPRIQNQFLYSFSPYFCNDLKVKEPTIEEIKKSNWSFNIQKELLKQYDINKKCLLLKSEGRK